MHILVEVSGGVVTNVLSDQENVTVWLRDYDELRERGFSDERAEQTAPTLFSGVFSVPPSKFTTII